MNWKLLNRFNCFLVRISKRVGLSAREGSVESHRVGLVGDGRTTCGRTGTARRSITRVSRPKIRCRWPRTPPRSSRATPSRLVTRRPTTACAPGWPTTAPSPPSKVQSTDLHWQRMCFFFETSSDSFLVTVKATDLFGPSMASTSSFHPNGGCTAWSMGETWFEWMQWSFKEDEKDVLQRCNPGHIEMAEYSCNQL